jgi:putative FmdB family regulatory protein
VPVYDYVCAACGRRFEVVHGVHVDGPTSCPLCGKGPVRKAISAAAVHYKGSGWAKKERRTAVAAGSSRGTGDAASKSAENSGTDADSKNDSKSDSKTGTSPASEGKASGSGSPAPSKSSKTDTAKPTD